MRVSTLWPWQIGVPWQLFWTSKLIKWLQNPGSLIQSVALSTSFQRFRVRTLWAGLLIKASCRNLQSSFTPPPSSSPNEECLNLGFTMCNHSAYFRTVVQKYRALAPVWGPSWFRVAYDKLIVDFSFQKKLFQPLHLNATSYLNAPIDLGVFLITNPLCNILKKASSKIQELRTFLHSTICTRLADRCWSPFFLPRPSHVDGWSWALSPEMWTHQLERRGKL